MTAISTVCFSIITIFHLGFGFGAYFQGGLYNKELWMVNGKPGTAETPLEKLLTLVFACWYLASILPVILAHVSDDKTAKQVTILCPLLYHIMTSIGVFQMMGSWNLINPEVTSHNGVGIIHAFLGVICVVLYRS